MSRKVGPQHLIFSNGIRAALQIWTGQRNHEISPSYATEWSDHRSPDQRDDLWPICGTGGFIVRFYPDLREINQRKIAERESLIRRLKEKQLLGVEHSPLVFKLALMNMILHRDGSSQLQNDDSLSNKAQDIHKGKYDIILANPPFGPTKQERLAQFEYHIKLYEALFIQHMMNALRPGGRAAVVLKEGLLFDSKKMLRKICRRLVEQYEVLVISLPMRFNPYSGAKTKGSFSAPSSRDDVCTSKVWFYR
jgi:type I restriction enzyme M protein